MSLVNKDLSDVIKYLETNISKQGDTVVFTVGHDSYLFQDGGKQDTLVKLVEVTATGITNHLAGEYGMITLV